MKYETVIILKSKVNKEEVNNLITEFKENIVKLNGEFLKLENIGIKKLVYMIKKENKGYYIVFTYFLNKKSLERLENSIKEDEKVLKLISVPISTEKEYNYNDIRAKITSSYETEIIKAFAIEILNSIERRRCEDTNFTKYVFVYEDIIDIAYELIENDNIWNTFDDEMYFYINQKIQK